MLIGRSGNFKLIAPFNTYSPSGLNGKIVQVSFIKHSVSRGINIETTVYKPVDFVHQYPTDLKDNVIIVTIQGTDNKKYCIPDIYIENLYDDNVTYVSAYITVRLNDLPLNTDFSFIRAQVAKEASQFSGVQVNERDVTVSISDRSKVYDRDVADIMNSERQAKIDNLTTDYGRYLKELKKSTALGKKLESWENKFKSFFS